MGVKADQVLCIGPNKQRAHAHAATLEQAGFSVTATATSADYLHISPEVDCIISTYRLEDTNGIALLREIRETHSNLPFILVARDGDETVASEAIKAGVTDYIPTDDGIPSNFAKRVANAVDTSRTHAGYDREVCEVYNWISDAFYVVDEEFRFTYVNESAEELLQADAEALLGECLWEEYPDARETEAYDAFHKALDTQQITEFERYSAPLDSWVEARIYPSATGFSVYVRDITDRKEREQALTDAYEIMVDSARSFDEQIDALLETVRAAFGTEYATLSYVSNDEYRFEAVATPVDSDLQAGDTVPLAELPNCEHVVETEQTLVLRDVEMEAPELADPTWGIASYLGAPVIVDGEASGTFCFYSMEARADEFPDWAVTFIEFLSNWVSREIEREQYTDQLTALETAFPDLGFLFDSEGRYLDYLAHPTTSELLYTDPDELLGQTLHEVLPSDTADVLLATIHDAIETGELQSVEYDLDVPAGTRCFEGRAAAVTDGAYGRETVVFIARDITDRKTHERTLKRRRDELADLHRINTLIRGITQGLQNTATRDEIETAVCDHLTESDLYQAAWIGTMSQEMTDDMAVTPQTVAGVEDPYVETIPTESGPATTALRSGEVQVVNDIVTADAFPDARREIALAHDHHTLAAVPLTTGETTYGVLVVYAPRDHTITEAERDVLGDLGQTIALAIQRVHSRRSLTAETTIELQLQMRNTTSVFGEVTSQLECELTFERHVPVSDGVINQYFTVAGAEPSQLCDRLMTVPFIDTCTVVRDPAADRQALIEVAISDPSQNVLHVLADHGASIRAACAAEGDIHVTAEVAPESDIRAIVDAAGDVTPTVELISKRSVDRPMTTIPTIVDQISNQLTTKQEAALSTAYTRATTPGHARARPRTSQKQWTSHHRRFTTTFDMHSTNS
ncbi:PAS domain-containing protein (plasmid) [Haloarcula sp. JP-L23]|nr:PAS domain-containing protein [Haloarcula sp. JP-L23]